MPGRKTRREVRSTPVLGSNVDVLIAMLLRAVGRAGEQTPTLGVPEAMDISEEKALEVAYSVLSPEQIGRSFVYWDQKVLKEGQQIRIGLQLFTVPFDGTMMFVDLAPRLNWAHPCLYLLVNIEDLSTEVVNASFPPYVDEVPETYRIILRYGKAPPHGRYFEAYDNDEGDAS
jgi:hypothetical protein